MDTLIAASERFSRVWRTFRCRLRFDRGAQPIVDESEDHRAENLRGSGRTGRTVHREHGGTNDLSNLICLCESHHLAHHAGTLVITRMGNGSEVAFKLEGRNSFTRKTREIATKKALEARGLGRDQVKEIIMRTVAKVAQSDRSEEQWLTIALRYATELAC